MINKRENLANIKSEKHTIVTKLNETITAEGSIEFENCKVKEVTYVPELSANLLSVHAVTEGGGEVLFTKDEVKIKFNNKTILKRQKIKNGLFQVNLKQATQENSFLTDSEIVAATLWHRKFGHISKKNLQILQTLCNGIKLT